MRLNRWVVPTADGLCEFGYEGTTPGGEAKVWIDGTSGTFPLILTTESRYRAILPLADHSCSLEMRPDGEDIRLIVDGAIQESASTEVPVAAAEGSSPSAAPVDPQLAKWLRRQKSGMGSFVMLIVLSVANAALIFLNSDISFPFSIFATSLSFLFGKTLGEEFGEPWMLIGGIVFAVVILGTYLLLYFLSRKRTWPVWVTFGLLVLDTGLIVAFGIVFKDLGSILVDLAFHVWMLWSLLSLGLARCRLKLKAAPSAEP